MPGGKCGQCQSADPVYVADRAAFTVDKRKQRKARQKFCGYSQCKHYRDNTWLFGRAKQILVPAKYVV